MKAPKYTHASARFSECRRFRYELFRRWSEGPTLAVIGLNPSKADEHQLDNTVSRCVIRAEALGFGALQMLNLFAFVSTDRSVLRKRAHRMLPIIGDENDSTLRKITARCDQILCAWGTHGIIGGRDEFVLRRVLNGRELYCLRKTQGGHPEHPLYLPYTCQPIPFRGVK